jgi:hypothetical protein
MESNNTPPRSLTFLTVTIAMPHHSAGADDFDDEGFDTASVQTADTVSIGSYHTDTESYGGFVDGISIGSYSSTSSASGDDYTGEKESYAGFSFGSSASAADAAATELEVWDGEAPPVTFPVVVSPFTASTSFRQIGKALGLLLR